MAASTWTDIDDDPFFTNTEDKFVDFLNRVSTLQISTRDQQGLPQGVDPKINDTTLYAMNTLVSQMDAQFEKKNEPRGTALVAAWDPGSRDPSQWAKLKELALASMGQFPRKTLSQGGYFWPVVGVGAALALWWYFAKKKKGATHV